MAAAEPERWSSKAVSDPGWTMPALCVLTAACPNRREEIQHLIAAAAAAVAESPSHQAEEACSTPLAVAIQTRVPAVDRRYTCVRAPCPSRAAPRLLDTCQTLSRRRFHAGYPV